MLPDTGRTERSSHCARLMPSLFERLAAADDGTVAWGSDHAAVIDSIVRNIRVNLNSHAGNVPTRPDWGLSDFHSFALRMDRAAPLLAQEIQRQIEAFEPRLRRVSVRHQPECERFMVASFDIRAELAFADGARRVSLETRIHANGAVLVN